VNVRLMCLFDGVCGPVTSDMCMVGMMEEHSL